MSDGTMFAGDHPRSGEWFTLKGRMLSPHLQPVSEQDKNMGPDRLNQEVSTGSSWTAFLRPVDSPTGGGGTLAH